MEIKLDKKESEEVFYDSLCNGSHYLGGYGLSLDYSKDDYTKAKESYIKKNPESRPCVEDVWMEILRTGGKLSIKDSEGDYNETIELKDVHERVSDTPGNHLLDAVNESGDAITADCILQTVFFKSVIFG
jgi:hypothetical protein